MKLPPSAPRPVAHWVMAAALGAVAFFVVNVFLDMVLRTPTNVVSSVLWAVALSGLVTYVLYKKAQREWRPGPDE